MRVVRNLLHIWTIPACSVREKLSRTNEMIWRDLAWHLPRKLAYWSLIHSGNRAFRSDEVITDVTFMAVLERTPGGRK